MKHPWIDRTIWKTRATFSFQVAGFGVCLWVSPFIWEVEFHRNPFGDSAHFACGPIGGWVEW